MMKAVWKYPVHYGIPGHAVAMPWGATVVKFGHQPDVGCVIWATVDPTRATRDRTFRIVATGEEYDDNFWIYTATTTDMNGLVWHLLEKAQC